MRLILMFDLPTIEAYERREYRIFRKNLVANGYIMIQFSVYMKCLNLHNKIEKEITKISKFIPSGGNVRIISVTEYQYQQMIFLVGSSNVNEQCNGSERYIKI